MSFPGCIMCVLALVAASPFVFAVESEQKNNLNIISAFSYNLTYPINKILLHNDSSYHEILKEALKQSSYVFYETDMLLNDIERILPLIALVEDLKPEGSNTKIILSLLCVDYANDLFLGKRLADMFYNLNSKLSLKHRVKFLNHISAITLDFRSKFASSITFFDSTPYALNEDISFTKYLKNFIKFHFGSNMLPVGVIYNSKLDVSNSDYIKLQISGADFVICYIELNLYTEFPMFRKEFHSNLQHKVDNSRNDQFLQSRRLHEDMTVLIQIADSGKQDDNSLYPYFSSGDYYVTFNRFMSATAHYDSTSKQFLKKTYDNTLGIFHKEIVEWATIHKEYPVIISNPIQSFEALTNNAKDESGEGKKNSKYIIPFWKIQEVDANVDEMKTNLSIWRNIYDTLAVDEKTWRTIARYQRDLEGDWDTPNHDASSTNGFLNGILNFPAGSSAFWKDIQNYMSELIHGSFEMAHVSLKTLIFDENDITSSEEIQKFLNISKQMNFSIGCSVSFDRIRRLFDRDTLFKSTIETYICQPMFDSFDTFVWHISDIEDNSYSTIRFKTSGIFSTYSDIFLAREIFMKEFNGTNVLIHFSTSRDKRILADLYEVPIIAPLS